MTKKLFVEYSFNYKSIRNVVDNHYQSGKPLPSIEKPEGDYPFIVTQSDGREVPVVQAYALTKYLGYLNLTFDGNGELIKYAGNPLLLDATYPQGFT